MATGVFVSAILDGSTAVMIRWNLTGAVWTAPVVKQPGISATITVNGGSPQPLGVILQTAFLFNTETLTSQVAIKFQIPVGVHPGDSSSLSLDEGLVKDAINNVSGAHSGPLTFGTPTVVAKTARRVVAIIGNGQ